MKILFKISILSFVLIFNATALIAQRARPQGRPIAPPPPKVFDYGTIEGNTYANKYLGIQFTLPDTWETQGQEFNDAIVKIGQSQMKGKTSQMQNKIDEAPQKVKILVSSKKTVGSAGAANFICSAEILDQPLLITSGTDYLRAMINGFRKSTLPSDYLYSDVIKQEKLGTNLLPYAETTKAGVIKQRFYSIVRKGYGITFVLTYMEDEDFQAMKKMMENANLSFK